MRFPGNVVAARNPAGNQIPSPETRQRANTGSGQFMETTSKNSRTVPHWEPKYPFDLVVAYEDTSTRNRALLLYDHLSAQLADDYDFQCTWWKFDHLCSHTLREQAADAAAAANMVMISLRSGHILPPLARIWIETWLSQKEIRKSALVGLVEERQDSDPATSPVARYLERIARKAKMDFFIHGFATANEPEECSLDTITERARKVTPLMQGILDYRLPTPKWGLNM
jgi:hypothetical protein